MKSNEIHLNLAVVPHDFLTKLEADIMELKLVLQSKTEDEKNSEWIESVKIPKILGISQKTWQTYRDKRLISYSQIGSNIYVKRADLEIFMESHRILTNKERQNDK